jgi:hypothetical protein
LHISVAALGIGQRGGGQRLAGLGQRQPIGVRARAAARLATASS